MLGMYEGWDVSGSKVSSTTVGQCATILRYTLTLKASTQTGSQTPGLLTLQHSALEDGVYNINHPNMIELMFR